MTLKQLARCVWGNWPGHGDDSTHTSGLTPWLGLGIPDPHWIDEQALKPHETYQTWSGSRLHAGMTWELLRREMFLLFLCVLHDL